jgi:hypothetical protein
MSPVDAQDQARLNRLPPRPAALDQRRRLIQRFRLTIPLQRPVVVTYLNAVFTEVRVATGIPEAVFEDVLHVRVEPRRVVTIPHACIVDIKALYR